VKVEFEKVECLSIHIFGCMKHFKINIQGFVFLFIVVTKKYFLYDSKLGAKSYKRASRRGFVINLQKSSGDLSGHHIL